VRVTAPDTPVPFSPPLEEAFLPNTAKVLEATRKLLAY
jgi:2-oxoisovalerate dehydrogenase E1 component beta subunit